MRRGILGVIAVAGLLAALTVGLASASPPVQHNNGLAGILASDAYRHIEHLVVGSQHQLLEGPDGLLHSLVVFELRDGGAAWFWWNATKGVFSAGYATAAGGKWILTDLLTGEKDEMARIQGHDFDRCYWGCVAACLISQPPQMWWRCGPACLVTCTWHPR